MTSERARNRTYALGLLCFYNFMTSLEAHNYVLASTMAAALVWCAVIIRDEWRERDEELPREYLNN